MKIYFVRHGETQFNLHHVLMGHTGNIELDQHGEEQAEMLAEKIAAMPQRPEIIFSSPLHRAQQTAAIIGKKIGAGISVRDDLGERDYGTLEGETYAKIQKQTGYSFPYIEQHLDIDLKKYGAENLSMLKMRLLHFLSEMKEKHASQRVLAVTHKGIITAMYQFFPQQSGRDIENASVHEFEV